MGPCVWKLCHDGVGGKPLGTLARDAVSRLGLPPVSTINLNSCTRLRQQTSHHSDRPHDGEFNRSSQHPEIGGCDDGLQTCLGSMHKKEVACARAPACLAA